MICYEDDLVTRMILLRRMSSLVEQTYPAILIYCPTGF